MYSIQNFIRNSFDSELYSRPHDIQLFINGGLIGNDLALRIKIMIEQIAVELLKLKLKILFVFHISTDQNESCDKAFCTSVNLRPPILIHILMQVRFILLRAQKKGPLLMNES